MTHPEEIKCPRCGALWINGVHHWTATDPPKPGNELDLAGLVCNIVQDPECINPSAGLTGGDTFEKRMAVVNMENDV